MSHVDIDELVIGRLYRLDNKYVDGDVHHGRYKGLWAVNYPPEDGHLFTTLEGSHIHIKPNDPISVLIHEYSVEEESEFIEEYLMQNI